MSDDFLSPLQEEPRPEFARSLEQRLRDIDERERGRRRARRPLNRLLAVAGLASLLALAFTLPPVRAAARGFLDLFRVKRFAAVPVDPERLARLQQGDLDLKTLVGQQVEVLVPSVEPEIVDGADAAAAAAGIVVRRPAVLPDGAALAEVRVGRPGSFRVWLDVAKLESLARALGVEDVAVPAEWDGAAVLVQASPVVALRYHRGDDDFLLLQSRSPFVELPEGVDLARLGTLGLRMAGMSAEEAAIFGRSIDWRSTLLVPIPADGGTFREVDVNGARGLLVTSFRRPREGADRPRGRGRWQSVLLWSAADEVFALSGPGNGVLVLEMARSIR